VAREAVRSFRFSWGILRIPARFQRIAAYHSRSLDRAVPTASVRHGRDEQYRGPRADRGRNH
jgi:hypothetical protein